MKPSFRTLLDVRTTIYMNILIKMIMKVNCNLQFFTLRFIFVFTVAYGPWWNHVASFYLHKDDENILIVSYEDMHKVRLYLAPRTVAQTPLGDYCSMENIGSCHK